jgi:hypothetical protein
MRKAIPYPLDETDDGLQGRVRGRENNQGPIEIERHMIGGLTTP